MGSGSKWRKAKLALGLNMCLYVPEARDRDSSPSPSSPSSNSTITTTATQPRLSDAVSLSPSGQATSPSSSAHRLSKSGNPKSSKVISRQTHFYFCFCHILLKGYYFYFLFLANLSCFFIKVHFFGVFFLMSLSYHEDRNFAL